MQILVEEIDGANTLAKAKVLSGLIKEKENKIASGIAKTAKIDGFRAGKVPVSAIIKRYSDQIRQDAEQEIFKEVLSGALEQMKKTDSDIIGEPMIEKFEKNDEGLDLEMKISFRPNISIDGYEEAIPEYSSPRVTKKEIQERSAKMLEAIAPFEDITENRGIKEKDFVKFDFEGFVDQVPFDGGKAENYTLEIGSKHFIPGFEEQMVGLVKGDEKEIKVVFPEEYGQKELAGKESIFKIKIHEIKEKKIPENPSEEILKRLLPEVEKPTLEMFEEKVKEQIKAEKLSKLFNEELKPKFIEKIVTKVDFDLPANIVEQEIDVQFRNDWRTFSPEEIEIFRKEPNKVQEKREKYRDDAARSVKLTFIVDELAKIKNIAVDDKEVVQSIYFEAYQYGQDPQKHFENYKEQGMLPVIKMSIIEEKLFQELFSKADKKGV